AVKTGTSQEYRDAWTVGYTPQLAIGVWIGNNDNKPMQALAGALGAAPVWKTLMTTLLQDKAPLAFTPPANITASMLCHTYIDTADNTPRTIRYPEYFITGSEPKRACGQPAPSPAPKIPAPIVARPL